MSDTFITGRDGEKIRLNTPESYTPNTNQHKTIDTCRIVGIDTESIIYKKKLKLKYLQLYIDPLQSFVNDVEDKCALDILFDTLLYLYGEPYERESRVKQRSKETKKARNENGRDGRRQTLKPILLSFFNMPYDLGRLVDKEEIFTRFVLFGQDALIFTWKDYQIEVIYSVIDGGSPSFQWIVKRPSEKKAVRIYGFDGTNYFLCSLKEAASSLSSMGVPEKLDLDKDLFIRDWYTHPPTKHEQKDFEKYANRDARIHKELYVCVSTILQDIDPYILNKQGLIGMSAGASSWRMIINKSSVDRIIPPKSHFQEMGLKSYYGGISFCLKPGIIEDISIIDIKSAYAHAATLIPAFETAQYKMIDPKRHDKNFTKDMWGCVCITGETCDSLYPPLVTTVDSHQVGIYGPFQKHWCTIPEIKIGLSRGVLRVDKILAGFTIEGTSEGGYKSFIEEMTKLKESSPKGGPLYCMAKLMGNSPYGKLIEKRKSVYACPRVTKEGLNTLVYDIKDAAFKRKCQILYIEKGFNAVLCAHEDYLKEHDMLSAEKCPEELYLDVWFQKGALFDSGTYFNAALASQITGFTRAKLMSGASLLHACQGDTDSLFFSGEKPGDFYDVLNQWGATTPSHGIGSFDVEASHLQLTAVKKKLYSGVDATGSIIKSGHHTIHQVDGYEKSDQPAAYLKIQQELLEKGESTYVSKPKPMKMREAWKRGLTCGLFLSHIMKLKLETNPYYAPIPEGQATDGYLHLRKLEDILHDKK